ncbi:hypothetical protein [Xanthomonas arboricola]|uniref:hypothetical protein n=1 Tax=Xanthomonas arboricola TaxID=56448 RepID=UPI0015E45D1F|nr:hypothetical protein [Xanthomonas arboricola]
MKFCLSSTLAAAVMSVGLLGTESAIAQKIDYLGASHRTTVAALAQPASVPAGVQLVELERWFYRDDTRSGRPLNTPGGMIYPGKKQGTLGFISYYPFEGSHTLYSCMTNDYRDLFTSTDSNCEGQLPARDMPITGYIASTQIAGTVPLYRCMRGGLKPNNWADHFDTLDISCENVKNPANDGIIGYIWL